MPSAMTKQKMMKVNWLFLTENSAIFMENYGFWKRHEKVQPSGIFRNGYILLILRTKNTVMNLLERISLNNEVLHGKPTIRNMRCSVAQLLELLAAEMTPQEILQDYPDLEMDDIRACLQYAAATMNSKIRVSAIAA